MSKDIRSYFFKSSSSSKPKLAHNCPQSKKRSHRVIESDDENDDDLIISKKKSQESLTTKSEKKKPEVVIEVEDFFGSKPVQQKKQTFPPKKPGEPKEKPPSKKQRKSDKKKETDKSAPEPCFQNDDELEASLLKTDDEELLLLENKKKDDTSEKKKVEALRQEKKQSPRKGDGYIKITPKKEINEKKTTPKRKAVLDVKQNKTPKQDQWKPDNSLLSSEQKRRNAEAYQKYLNRSGPKNPGSKTIPKGTPTCLQGLTFVITGVLDSLEREEATELIQKCGGRVTGSVSKKTDYVVVGEEPGASKIQKADSFRTKKINEDGLLSLIEDRSDAGGSQENDFVEGTPEKSSKYLGKESPRKKVKKMKAESTPSKKIKIEEKKAKPESKVSPPLNKTVKVAETEFKDFEKTSGNMLWVDKYKPKSTKNIVGQSGDKSNVKKLIKWLENWHKNHSKEGKKAKRPAPWAQNDDGGYYKAALLSGPPGVGKTTTVHLVCEELGFDVIEFNASDTRSKRLLQEEVSELLSTKSVRGFLKGKGTNPRQHVLVMDEVDGMAGSEDRGGIQELIQLIKTTKIPIVGMCNDRNHPKMRSLVNYCFDLRFQRPRIEQIKGAMKSICFKEKLEISGEALEELIVASNHDVRQVLHNLSLLVAGHDSLSLEEAKKKAQQAKKPLSLGPWDVVRKVFSASEQEKMSFTDKSDLFFQDYSLGPLFVQDTYIRVKPYKAKNEEQKLKLISKTADSLALGDIVDKAIRSKNAWSLLPLQAIFSSVLPGHHMSGHVQGQIQFPVWLGKNSKSNKFDRLLQDLNSSLRINTSGSKESVNLDYLGHLKNRIVKPLVEEGAEGVRSTLQFMLDYHLTREDLYSILELSSWPGVKDYFSEIDSKVKAALTRALNKEGQTVVSARKSIKVKGDPESFDGEDGEEDVEEESENIYSDPMIKVGKPKVKKDAEEKSKKEEKKKVAPKKETKKGKK